MTHGAAPPRRYMKELNKAESLIFLIGAVMMVVGSGAFVFRLSWAPYVFATGAIAFVLMQLKQSYEGPSVAIRRLRRIVVFSDVLFLLTALLMFADIYSLLPVTWVTYVQYVHNNWVVTLLAAAILQLYTTHRISAELGRQSGENQ